MLKITAATLRHRVLVARGITQRPLFPPLVGPEVMNQTLHLMCAKGRSPIDRAALEMIVTSNAIRRGRFIGCRISKHARFPAHAGPLGANVAMHLMCTK